jgi:patatin-like phospholipase/acyl hydrolase
MTTLDTVDAPAKPLRVLTLDGGGAKGFYTLGVLKEIEAMSGCPLHEKFDLIFGTSTGSIIAALIALGKTVEEILALYREHVPKVMSNRRRATRTRALNKLANEVFLDAAFTDVKTRVGIVAAKWLSEQPMIFKGSVEQAHGRAATFVPGFGVRIADAVQASCSAYPFFERTTVKTSTGEQIELIDGGYCANNPTLYAIADAVHALKRAREDIRIVSVGCGRYPEPKKLSMWFAKNFLYGVELLQKTLEINTQSMDQLRQVLFHDVPTIRISDAFTQPAMATDLLEHDVSKLNVLFTRGRESFSAHEKQLATFLL